MKKAINLMFATMTMAVMMSSCSANGTPIGLVGTWKRVEIDGYAVPSLHESFMRIDADDSVWYKHSYGSNSYDWTHTQDIIRCTCTEVTMENEGGSEYTSKYELSETTLIMISKNGGVTKYERQ